MGLVNRYVVILLWHKVDYLDNISRTVIKNPSLITYFMNKLGPIIIIDNDLDDLDLIGDALHSIKVNNKILLFSRATEFLKYMREDNESAFFILCDINMPNMDGIELFKLISADSYLSTNCFPFLFFSTSAGHNQIDKKTMHQFIDSLKVNEEIKKELRKITPHNYTGMVNFK